MLAMDRAGAPADGAVTTDGAVATDAAFATDAAVTADGAFAALASPVRRQVLQLLRERGPQPVAELAGHFDMARPSLSEHLRALLEAGLVTRRKVGRQRIYRLEAAPLRDVLDWLDPFEQFWRERLTGLSELLDGMDGD
jgi:DNA-binding transcriptional ArsR family regulator